MILSPLQNKAAFIGNYIQVRPTITQEFGLNPNVYKQFNLRGHNGIDFRCISGTPIFAPMDGVVKTADTGNSGYGLHIRIRNAAKCIEIVLGHLSNHSLMPGQRVSMGDKIGESGNSGFSTGSHLHMGVRFLNPSNKDVWAWDVKDVDNGYAGYVDFLDKVICFKGTLILNNL